MKEDPWCACLQNLQCCRVLEYRHDWRYTVFQSAFPVQADMDKYMNKEIKSKIV